MSASGSFRQYFRNSHLNLLPGFDKGNISVFILLLSKERISGFRRACNQKKQAAARKPAAEQNRTPPGRIKPQLRQKHNSGRSAGAGHKMTGDTAAAFPVVSRPNHLPAVLPS
jgi:hypothetical protein